MIKREYPPPPPPTPGGGVRHHAALVCDQSTKYRHKTKAVEAVRELVGLMGKLSLAPPAGVLSVLERALLLVGKNKTDMCDARYAPRAF